MADVLVAERRAKALAESVGIEVHSDYVIAEDYDVFVVLRNPSSLDFVYRRVVDFQQLFGTTPKLTRLRVVGVWENVDTYDMVEFTEADNAEIVAFRYNRPPTVWIPRTNERIDVDIVLGARRSIAIEKLDEWDNVKRW